jgi:hypothetical protein
LTRQRRGQMETPGGLLKCSRISRQLLCVCTGKQLTLFFSLAYYIVNYLQKISHFVVDLHILLLFYVFSFHISRKRNHKKISSARMRNDFVCMGDIVSESNSKFKLVLNTSLVWRMQITQLLLV